MKKNIRRIVTFLLLGTLITGVTGCGGSSTQTAQTLQKEFCYISEYRELEITSEYIQNVVQKDDVLYMLGYTWNEQTEEGTCVLYGYHLGDGTYCEAAVDFLQNVSVQQMILNEAGNLLLVIQRYEEMEEYTELWEISASDGKLLSKTDIHSVFDETEGFYLQYVVMDADGNLYMSDGSTCIYVTDQKGNKMAEITLNDWIDGLFATKEGNVFAKMWGDEGIQIKPVDLQTKKLLESVKAEKLVENDNSYNQMYYKGIETSLLVSDSRSLFTYDFDSDTSEEIFTWLDVDVNSDNVDVAGQLGDGRFFAMLQEYDGEKWQYSVVLLEKVPVSEAPVKQELVYGTLWLNQDIRNDIIDFNKSNDQYRITVKEYLQTDDYDAAVSQFNNDIISGNCPDIINITNLEFERYAGKGVFEDLYPYMEKDGIQQSEYLENVLGAYEIKDSLYAIIPQFYVSSAAIKSSRVGDATGWTLDEMLNLAENSDVGKVFCYGTRSSVFYYCVYNNIDEFINWETGECFFDSEEFIRVLEFAAQFPEEADYKEEMEGISEQIRNDNLLVLETQVSSVQEYQMMTGLFGEKITFIGYPNSERKGNLIQPANDSIAISAQSNRKDAAWEFVKIFLSEEYQNNLVKKHNTWGFPIKKSALDKQFENDMTPDYYDINGKQIENPKTTWGYDDFQMDIYAATSTEVDAVRNILTSAEKIAGRVNEELIHIITEETQAFFQGQKSVGDTVRVIQNRIQIYVNENS